MPNVAAISIAEVAKLPGELADALAKIVKYGTQAWDAGTRRRTRKRLTEMSVRTRGLIISNTGAELGLEDYASTWRRLTANGRRPPNASDAYQLDSAWAHAMVRLEAALDDGYGLLNNVQKERSAFALTDGFHELYPALRERAEVVQRLRALPRPRSPDEIKAFRALLANYRRLRGTISMCVSQLNDHVQRTEEKSVSSLADHRTESSRE